MEKKPNDKKAELLLKIEVSWKELNDVLGHLSKDQLTNLQDPQGWTVKDHIIHLTAWQRMVVLFLQCQPRYSGLKVEKELFFRGSVDEINDVIHKQNKEMPLSKALSEFREGYQQLLLLLKSISESELEMTYHQFNPDEAEDHRLVREVVYSNTAGHYIEHVEWIHDLVEGN